MGGVSRKTVYRARQLGGPPERKRGDKRCAHVLTPFEPSLPRRWQEGWHNGLRLWREIREQGFASSSTNVARFVAQLRRGEPLQRAPRTVLTSVQGPSARQVAFLFLRRPEKRTAEQDSYRTQVCQADPAIASAYALTQDFAGMLRARRGEELDAWIGEAVSSDSAEVRGFATGLTSDHAAVQAGLTLGWSQGQTEGQVHRLKLINRSMYGRAGFDLLRQRVLQRA